MRDLFSVGITGTNGKTTVSTLCHQLMSAASRESGLIGTIETRIGSDVVASKRTTPEAAELQALAAVMRERHCRNLVMEVSSHAIAQERIRGAHFNIAAFTNLSQDHLDFHGTIEAYFAEKAKLFTFEYADAAFINIDDAYGALLAEQSEIPVTSLSRSNVSADWHYASIETGISRTQITIRGIGGILIETTTQLHGGYNLDNLLLAVAITCESGIDPIDIASLVPHLTGAQGRLESISLGQNFTAFVDYAHSPDAVERVLATAHEITTGRVIGVLGCGGDRDRTKRPLMGKALLDGCDIAIFTSDNPRSENPQSILDEMVKGLSVKSPHAMVIDRADAIAQAVAAASEGDVLLVLGKGHEKGQEIAGTVQPFDDRIALAQAIEAKR
jgi:UDP-N-acetylmuramoyl-L-alanyl-D-glutamate--2,6-diaminopimelate ligase